MKQVENKKSWDILKVLNDIFSFVYQKVADYSGALILFTVFALLLTPLIFYPHSQQLSWALKQGWVAMWGVLLVAGVLAMWVRKKRMVLGKIHFTGLFFLGLFGLFALIYLVNGTLFNPLKPFYSSAQGPSAIFLPLVFSALVFSSFVFSVDIWRGVIKVMFGISALVSVFSIAALLKTPYLATLFLGSSQTSPLLMSVNKAGIYAGLGLITSLGLLWAVKNRLKIFETLPVFYERILLVFVSLLSFLMVITVCGRFLTVPLLGALTAIFLCIVFLSLSKNFKGAGAFFFLILLLLAIFTAGGEMFRFRWVGVPVEADLTQEASLNIYSSLSKNEGVITALVGGGESSFYNISEQYKPKEISSSSFWDVSFLKGSGEFTTMLVEAGFLGMLAIIALLVLMLVLFIRIINLGFYSRRAISKMNKEQVLRFKERLLFSVILLSLSFYILLISFFYPLGLGLWVWLLVGVAGAGALEHTARFAKANRSGAASEISMASMASMASMSSAENERFLEVVFKRENLKYTTPLAMVALLMMMLTLCVGVYSVRRAGAEAYIASAQKTEVFSQKISYYTIARNILPDYPRALIFQSHALLNNVIGMKNKMMQEGELSREDQKKLLDQIELSLRLGERAVEVGPSDPYLPFVMVDTYFQLAKMIKEPENALRGSLLYINKAKELTSYNPRPYFKEAQVWFEIAKIKDSEGAPKEKQQALSRTSDALSETLKINENFINGRIAEIELERFKNNFAKVTELGERFLKQWPENISVRQYTAEAYYWQRDFEKARSYVKKVLKQKHAYLPALVLGGKLACWRSDFDTALDYFERVRAQEPELSKLSNILAEIRQNRNPFESEFYGDGVKIGDAKTKPEEETLNVN